MRDHRNEGARADDRRGADRRGARRLATLATFAVVWALPLTAAMAQDSTTSLAAGRPDRASPRAVRLVIAGGMTVPTGGFANYHDLGVQASGSLLLRLLGQRLRLRPEVIYNRFDVVEAKVRALVPRLDLAQAQAQAHASRRAGASRGDGLAGRRASALVSADPKLPDLTKMRDGAISSLLGTFANIEIPLGPDGFQPYLIGGVGAVAFRTDVTTVNEAIDGVQWALNAGAGIRFRLGPIGGGLEARFREIPVDGARTFFDHVTAIPISFSLIF